MKPLSQSIPLSALNYWARNYNKGDIPRIKASLERFGYVRRIVVWKEGIVPAGNGTLRALRELQDEYTKSGKDPVHGVTVRDGEWCIEVTDASHLETLAEVEAYAIADNVTASHAEADETALFNLLQDLGAVDETLVVAAGFSDEDMQALIDRLNGEVDAVPDITPPGDPGEERYKEQYGVIVICDDATHQETVYETLHGMGYTVKVVVT